MTERVYPRGYYEHQLACGRSTGQLKELSALQVRVEIAEPDLEKLVEDARDDAPVSSGNDSGLRLVAKGTLSRIRMARQLEAGLKKGRYSEVD